MNLLGNKTGKRLIAVVNLFEIGVNLLGNKTHIKIANVYVSLRLV